MGTTWERSASSHTMNASLPPSSSTTGVSRSDAAAITLRPTPVLPTNTSLPMSAVTSACPASPYPVTICTRSGGAPAATSAARMTRP